MAALIEDNQIFGVLVKQLKSHQDERGFFREVIRFSDPFFENAQNFGQWSHSRMIKDVVKAWHYHHLQTDWWYLGIGLVEAVLIDNREESPTYRKKIVFKMGSDGSDKSDQHNICVKIPPGVLHGCKVLTPEAHLFYVTSHLYNPNDEGRFPFNAGPIDHPWGENALVVDNDKKAFEPVSPRSKLKF